MKVPIRYKSSDRYNAGVDVVYDDESKLQYAPFIYATTASGDNGGSGEDEEGEDSMVINVTNGVLDKHASEILENMNAGKCCIVVANNLGDSLHEYVTYVYSAVASNNANGNLRMGGNNTVRTITGNFDGTAVEHLYKETDGGFPTLVEGDNT